MQARELMTQPVMSVRTEASLAEVARTMSDEPVGGFGGHCRVFQGSGMGCVG